MRGRVKELNAEGEPFLDDFPPSSTSVSHVPAVVNAVCTLHLADMGCDVAGFGWRRLGLGRHGAGVPMVGALALLYRQQEGHVAVMAGLVSAMDQRPK